MARTPSTMQPLGSSIVGFDLHDTQGERVSLKDFEARPLLVMFICNHCPFVVHIREGLAQFAREYSARGLSVVAINSNDAEAYPADSPELMREEHLSHGYVFPYLYDESQEVAKAFGAACTPDFFLYDSDHRLVYRGQFDSSRPMSAEPVTGADLRRACDALLEGRALEAEQRPSLGCNIKWKPGNEPEYF